MKYRCLEIINHDSFCDDSRKAFDINNLVKGENSDRFGDFEISVAIK